MSGQRNASMNSENTPPLTTTKQRQCNTVQRVTTRGLTASWHWCRAAPVTESSTLAMAKGVTNGGSHTSDEKTGGRLKWEPGAREARREESIHQVVRESRSTNHFNSLIQIRKKAVKPTPKRATCIRVSFVGAMLRPCTPALTVFPIPLGKQQRKKKTITNHGCSNEKCTESVCVTGSKDLQKRSSLPDNFTSSPRYIGIPSYHSFLNSLKLSGCYSHTPSSLLTTTVCHLFVMSSATSTKTKPSTTELSAIASPQPSVQTQTRHTAQSDSLPLVQASRRWPKVVGYCLALTSTILLGGYYSVVIGNVVAVPSFQ